MALLGRNINSNGIFLLDMKKVFAVRAVKHWSRLSRKRGESLFPEVFRPKQAKPHATSSAFNDNAVLSWRFGFSSLNYSVIMCITILISSAVYM